MDPNNHYCSTGNTANANVTAATQFDNWLTGDRNNLMQSALAARINMNLVLRNSVPSFSCPNTPVNVSNYPKLPSDAQAAKASAWTPTLAMSHVGVADTLPLLAHLQQQQAPRLVIPSAQSSFTSGIACPTVVPPVWFLQHRRNEEQASVHSYSASASPASSTECSSPLDLSSKSSLNDIPSEADEQQQVARGSILRNLLSSNSASTNDVSGVWSHPSGENSCVLTPSSCASCKQPPLQLEEEANESCSVYSALMECKLRSGSECEDVRVCLAKKNLHPVSARVTSMLQQIVRFCEEIPAFKQLCSRDQARLLQDAWHYLLLLCMAEQNFQFAVSVCSNERTAEEDSLTGNSSDTPTLRFVDSLQSLIRRLHALALDRVEYGLLMTAVLFHSGQQHDSSLSPEKCTELSRLYNCVLLMLQQRMSSSRDARSHDQSPSNSNGYNAYTRLLLTLPAIYSIRQSLVQTFFFGAVNLDVCTYVSKLLTKDSLEHAQTP